MESMRCVNDEGEDNKIPPPMLPSLLLGNADTAVRKRLPNESSNREVTRNRSARWRDAESAADQASRRGFDR